MSGVWSSITQTLSAFCSAGQGREALEDRDLRDSKCNKITSCIDTTEEPYPEMEARLNRKSKDNTIWLLPSPPASWRRAWAKKETWEQVEGLSLEGQLALSEKNMRGVVRMGLVMMGVQKRRKAHTFHRGDELQHVRKNLEGECCNS